VTLRWHDLCCCKRRCSVARLNHFIAMQIGGSEVCIESYQRLLLLTIILGYSWANTNHIFILDLQGNVYYPCKNLLDLPCNILPWQVSAKLPQRQWSEIWITHRYNKHTGISVILSFNNSSKSDWCDLKKWSEWVERFIWLAKDKRRTSWEVWNQHNPLYYSNRHQGFWPMFPETLINKII